MIQKQKQIFTGSDSGEAFNSFSGSLGWKRKQRSNFLKIKIEEAQIYLKKQNDSQFTLVVEGTGVAFSLGTATSFTVGLGDWKKENGEKWCEIFSNRSCVNLRKNYGF